MVSGVKANSSDPTAFGIVLLLSMGNWQNVLMFCAAVIKL